MARLNRVQPTGEFLAHPSRGLFMGNRGILHDETGTLGNRRWKIKGWVTCSLTYKARKRRLMQPGSYTELFFHDEAVAMAAGHRPCAECRRSQYIHYKAAAEITGPIAEFDALLHSARAIPRVFGQRRHHENIADLPDGTFILDTNGVACLIWRDEVHPHAPDGYGLGRRKPLSGTDCVLTPDPSIRALRNGYDPVVGLPA